eukprot:855838_1
MKRVSYVSTKRGREKQWFLQHRKFTTLYQCKGCKIDKRISEFSKKSPYRFGINTTNCKQCQRKYQYQRRCTPLGYFNKLKGDAKSRQKARYMKRGLHPPVFPLTDDYLYELYEKQNGRGFYSHISMNL